MGCSLFYGRFGVVWALVLGFRDSLIGWLADGWVVGLTSRCGGSFEYLALGLRYCFPQNVVVSTALQLWYCTSRYSGIGVGDRTDRD